jgi:hypothetical protein
MIMIPLGLIGKCCAQAVAALANELIHDDGINRYNDATGENSMTHCFIACSISKVCGAAGRDWWNGRENPNKAGGKQDINNNEIGFKFASQEGSCWPKCLDAWNNGGLDCGGKPCPPRKVH